MSKKTTRSSISMIIIFTLASKLLGFAREVMIASKFGSGTSTDSFFVALSITSLVSGFISNAVTTTFIPILTEIESKEGESARNEHTNNMINILVGVSIILVIIGVILSPLLVKLFAKGFTGDQFNMTVSLTRIGFPMVIFSGLIGTFTGYLQSKQKHMSAAATGLPFNLIFIFYLIFLSSFFGLKGLMLAGVIAIISQVLIQLPEAISVGFRYRFIFDIKDKYIKKAFFLSIPIMIGVAINDLNLIVDKTMASELVAGSISALNYGNKLNNLVKGVFVTAVATVIFPVLSKKLSERDINGADKIIGQGINFISLITIPSTIGLIVLAYPIVELVFERGAFGYDETIMTSQALVFYALGLFASSINILIVRVYYSLQDTRTPMLNSVIMVIINIILNIILVKYMKHSGLALATSISNIVAMILLLYSLKKKVTSLNIKNSIKVAIKCFIASLLMGLVLYYSYNNIDGILSISKNSNIISLSITIVLGIISYGIVGLILKIDEIHFIFDAIKRKINI